MTAQDRRDPRGRDRPRSHRRGLEGGPGGRGAARHDSTTTWAGAGTWRPARCCPTRCSTSCGASTPSSSAPSAPPRYPRACWSGVCCCGCASSSTCTSTCGPSWRPSCRRRRAVDFTVVRENTEGTYAGEGGFLRKGTAAEVATQGSVNTRFGVERCVRFAFDLARSRDRRHLTLVHKTNVLTFSGDLWQRTFDQVAVEYPDVPTAYNHVDAACIYFVRVPRSATTSS